MDSKDVLIFCEMGFKYIDYTAPRRRPDAKKIGRKLGLGEKTVRLRVQKMERNGFIQYYQVIPNLSIFGLPSLSLWSFQGSDVSSKQESLRHLLTSDQVVEVVDMIGKDFGATVASSTEEEALGRTNELTKLTNASSAFPISYRKFTSTRSSLDRLDWKLIKTLRANALRRTNQIAKELGITYRMADYRITKLLDSKAVVIKATLSAHDRQGILFYSIVLSVDEKRKERILDDLMKKYGERVIEVHTPPGPLLVLNLFGTSIGEAENSLLEVLPFEGVKTGNLSFFKGEYEPERPSWIDSLIEEKIVGI